MPNQQTSLDRVFHALSDSTRLSVLARLSNGPATVSELAKPFDMALPSFTQHLRVLEENGLVSSRKKGRVRTYQFTPQTLKVAEDWIENRRGQWARRLDQLDSYLGAMKAKANE